MARFSANLGFLWSDNPLLDRIELAAQHGFKAIELHWPYDTPAQAVRDACQRLGLTLLAANTPLGNTQIGESGLAALPGRENDFKDTFLASLQWCLTAGASAMHVMPGVVENNSASTATMVKNLQWASAQVPAGFTLLLEAINQRDKPGYFYHTQAQSNAIREATGCANVKLMFDVYHVGVAEGDVLTKLAKYMPHIGHIQIAAVPSRAEPDEGEINYPVVIAAIDKLGYTSWIGAEYKPRASVETGLGWMKAY